MLSFCRSQTNPYMNEPTEETKTGYQNEFNQLMKLFDVHREYVKVEHSLQHERTTWHLAIQGFLFAFLGVLGEWPLENKLIVEREYLPMFLALAGIAVAIVSLLSVFAADTALNRLHDHWNDEVCQEPRYRQLLSLIPKVSGGGYRKGRNFSNGSAERQSTNIFALTLDSFRDSLPERLGKIELLSIPFIIMIAWIFVLLMIRSDKKRVAPPNPCEVRQQDKPTQIELSIAALCAKENDEFYTNKLQTLFHRTITVQTDPIADPPKPALPLKRKNDRQQRLKSTQNPTAIERK